MALARAARIAFEARERDEAAALLRQLVATRAPFPTTWGPLSRMAAAIGECTTAIEAARLHVAMAPEDFDRQLELAGTLASFSRSPEATALGEHLAKRYPDTAGGHHFLGTQRMQLGQHGQAEECFRRSIAAQPIASPSWLPLSALKRFTADDPDIATLRREVTRLDNAPAPVRGSIYYALAKALDDIGDVDAAFAAYSEGATQIRKELPYEESNGPNFVAELRQGFDDAFLRSLEPSTVSSERVIFVLGLPRSGTTLMEQILVAHSQVAQGGEIGVFRHAAMAIERFSPEGVRAFLAKHKRPQGAWTRIGESYLHLVTERFGPEGRVIDKSLSTPSQLGVIAHTLPNARFIWMKREIGPVAWSCFKTRFSQGQNWSWSLPEIAGHFRSIDAMYDHWAALFPDRILTLNYEDLVEDPETWIPRALAHVGLPDEAQTRRFYEVERAVQTASNAQVRRPIYKGSGDPWRRYAKHMQPFFDAYEKP